MRLEHIETQHFARPIGQQLSDRDEVAEALRHLLAFDFKEAVVHPVVRHNRSAVRAARLSNLVLMMRKDQIESAAMDVEDITEIGGAHGGTLDVPARTSPAPRTFPTRLVLR